MNIRVSLSLVKPKTSVGHVSPEAALDNTKLEAGTDYEKLVTSIASKYASDNRFEFDQAAPLDITIVNTTKVLADHSIVAENISKGITTRPSDSAGLSDKVVTLLMINRRFVDTASVSSDIRNIDSSKAFSDSYYGVTSAPTFSIGKLLQDHAYATDDFFGETNVDDDQSMVFTKVSASSASSTDNFDRTVSFNRVFYDSLNNQVVDSFGISSTKIFVENYSATDNVDQFAVTKSLTDTASTQSQTTFSLSATKQDELRASDVFTRDVSFSRDFADDGSVTDNADLSVAKAASDSAVFFASWESWAAYYYPEENQQELISAVQQFQWDPNGNRAPDFFWFGPQFDVTKPVEDSFNVQDTFTRSVTSSRSFTDRVFLTDDINGLASLDDDQTMLFNKFVTHTILTSDSDPELSFEKNITDSGAVSDSGQLYAQGYMDNMDYFALGYVGTTGSF